MSSLVSHCLTREGQYLLTISHPACQFFVHVFADDGGSQHPLLQVIPLHKEGTDDYSREIWLDMVGRSWCITTGYWEEIYARN